MKKNATQNSSISETPRNSPAHFPVGFRFGDMNGETCFVDFLDASTGNGGYYIFNSIALSRTTAKQLHDGLIKFLENDQN